MPGGQDAAVAEPDGPGRGAGQLLHDPAHLHAAVGAVAGPVRERVGREAGVGDEADVGPAVAQAEDGVGVGEHLAAGVEVPLGVVGERGVEEVAAVVLRQQVEEQLGGVDAPGRGQPQHARLGRGLVVGHVAQRVQAAVVDRAPPAPLPAARAGVVRRLHVGQEPGPEGRVAQRARPARRRAVPRQSRVGRERRAAGGRRTAARPAARPGAAPPGPGWAGPRPPRPRSGPGGRARPRDGGGSAPARGTAGTPVRATMARTNSNSPSVSGQKSEISSTTPCPASATPRAMASSSSVPARSDGVGSPLAVRWFSVRDVEKPMAPARRASVARRRMAAVSSGVASSSRAARSPMT